MILSYQAGRYGRLDTFNSQIHPLVMILSLDTLNSKIRPLFQILDTKQGWCNNFGTGGGAGREAGGVQFY